MCRGWSRKAQTVTLFLNPPHPPAPTPSHFFFFPQPPSPAPTPAPLPSLQTWQVRVHTHTHTHRKQKWTHSQMIPSTSPLHDCSEWPQLWPHHCWHVCCHIAILAEEGGAYRQLEPNGQRNKSREVLMFNQSEGFTSTTAKVSYNDLNFSIICLWVFRSSHLSATLHVQIDIGFWKGFFFSYIWESLVISAPSARSLAVNWINSFQPGSQTIIG